MMRVRFASLALSAVVLLSLAVGSGRAFGAAPAFSLVYGAPLDSSIVLNGAESFAFEFGTIVYPPPSDLRARPFLSFALFWNDANSSRTWREFLDAGGDPRGLDPSEGNQDARLYFGTETDPPIFAFQNKHPGGWPVRSAEFNRYLGPQPLAILALHGIPTSLTDPFGRARVGDDPPIVTSGGETILPIALPSAGSGGLADERSRADAWLWAGMAAMVVVMAGGAGRAIRRRRRRP